MSKKTFKNLLLVIIYVLMLIIVGKIFKVWSQITLLEAEGSFPSITHPHFTRYIVMLPIIYVSKLANIQENTVFTGFVAIAICVTAYFGSRFASLLVYKNLKNWPDLFGYYFAIFSILSFFMNGRFSIALLGVSIIIYGQVIHLVIRNSPVLLSFIYLCIGAFLASVSSGSFMIAIMVILMFLIYILVHKLPKISSRDIKLWFMFMLPGFGLSYYGMILFKKNLSFFDGSVFLMLEHGYGNIFYDSFLLVIINILILFSLIVFVGVIYYLFNGANKYQRGPFLVIIFLTISTLLVGIFGWFALAIGIIVVATMMHVILLKIHSKKFFKIDT